jgi:hypothetical protein
MAELKETYDSLDEIEENLRENYVEHDGKYTLKFVVGLKKNNATLLAEKKGLANKISTLEAEYEKYKDLDPAKAKEALDKLAAIEAETQKTKGDWDSREKALNEGWTNKVSEKERELKKRDEALDTLVIDNEILRCCALEEVNGEGDLLKPFVRPFVRRKGLNDYEILDKDGNVRYDPNNAAQPLRMKEFLLELKEGAYARLFNVTEPSGSGTTNTNSRANGGTPTNLKRSKMTYKEKSDYISKHGQEKFLQLPA